jgi:ATP-dependent DNA helicase RecG
MKNNGSPVPEFETDEERLHFLIRLPVHPKTGKSMAGIQKNHKRPTQASTQSPTQSGVQSANPVDRLLFVLKQGEMSSMKLRLALGIKHRPTFRENYLHPALDAGLIELTIPEKPNSRLQKYRLTGKGGNPIGVNLVP